MIKINGVGEILHLLGSRGQTKDYIIHYGLEIMLIKVNETTFEGTAYQYEECSSTQDALIVFSTVIIISHWL